MKSLVGLWKMGSRAAVDRTHTSDRKGRHFRSNQLVHRPMQANAGQCDERWWCTPVVHSAESKGGVGWKGGGTAGGTAP